MNTPHGSSHCSAGLWSGFCRSCEYIDSPTFRERCCGVKFLVYSRLLPNLLLNISATLSKVLKQVESLLNGSRIKFSLIKLLANFHMTFPLFSERLGCDKTIWSSSRHITHNYFKMQYKTITVCNILVYILQLGTNMGRRRIHQDCQKPGQQVRSCNCCELPTSLTGTKKLVLFSY